MEHFGIIILPDAILHTSKISSTSRIILDAMLLLMRAEDNYVGFVEGGLNRIMQTCKELLNKSYSEKTIRNSVSELLRTGVLKRISSSRFQVNGKLFRKIVIDTEELTKAE